MRMSSTNTINYTELAGLVESCGKSNVKKIRFNGISIEFHNNHEEVQFVENTFLSPVDSDSHMGDNENTEESDATLSTDIATDTIEDLMFTDPLEYEKAIKELANDQDR